MTRNRAVAALIVLTCIAAAWTFYRSRTPVPSPAFGGSEIDIALADRVHFMQTDPRWAAERLGGTTDRLAATGCTVASVAMAMTNLGHAIDPKDLNAALTAAGGFTEHGWLVWDAVERVTKGALRAGVHAAPSLDGMDACLQRGDYPIVKFLIGGVVQHWVVLVGKRGGEFLMRDPLIGEPDPVPLTRRTPVVLSVRCIGRVAPR